VSWREVWEKRSLDRSRPLLEALMAADGLDTGYGSVGADNWSAFVVREAARLGLGPGRSVFEVGCGAGAFLYELDRLGCAVGGLDASSALVAIAREVFARGEFTCAEASALATEPQADVVLACGVFLYFPSLDYARGVLQRMAAKCRGALALYDLPDAAT
jgi:predicted TPR repeat methyltransferase